MTIKKLNKCQTRWVEFLAEFDFKIAYESEKKNDKADSLTRRLENRSVDEADDRNKHMHQTVLSSEKVNSRILQKLNDIEEENSELSLFDRVKIANQENSTCVAIRHAIRNKKKFFDEMLLKKFESIKKTLFFKKKLWIFEFDQLKFDIIRKIHDQSASEHSDVRRTCKYLFKWYYWSQTKQSIKKYIRNFHICKRFKAIRDKYFELLNSLSISNRSWTNIILNFVIELSRTKNDFNAILMTVNRLTKMHHYISCVAVEEDISAEEIVRLLISHVWKLHELSSTIISDRESQFISLVWKSVCRALKIDVKLSTTFHSKIDDKSEIVNSKIKRYLRNYCNYQRDNWFEWLSMIEFALNAVISASTELFVFMTNYEFEFRMFFDSSTKDNQRSTKKRVLIRKDSDIINKMKNIWDFIKKKLTNAQNMQKRYENQKRTSSSEYEFEDMIWLFIKNIKVERSFRKLDHKWIESYKIKKVLKNACRLKLSSLMKIHNTFHISLLRKTAIDSFIEQIQSSSSSIIIDEEEKYEINDILDNRYHYDKLQYKVVWIDHSSDKAWYLAENFQKHSKEIFINYHQRYSDKSESKLRLIASIALMTDHFYWLQQAKNLVKNTLNKMQTKMKDNRKEFNKSSFVTNVLARKELWVSAY
jgi:hypothetical protein